MTKHTGKDIDEGILIFFEDQQLPKQTYFIDALGMYGILPERSEEVSEWLWRLTVCNGRERTEDSQVILKHVNVLLGLIDTHQPQIIDRIEQHYDGRVEATTLLVEWISALRLIGEIAADRESCTWYGRES